jgi:hypothetical protein
MAPRLFDISQEHKKKSIKNAAGFAFAAAGFAFAAAGFAFAAAGFAFAAAGNLRGGGGGFADPPFYVVVRNNNPLVFVPSNFDGAFRKQLGAADRPLAREIFVCKCRVLPIVHAVFAHNSVKFSTRKASSSWFVQQRVLRGFHALFF